MHPKFRRHTFFSSIHGPFIKVYQVPNQNIFQQISNNLIVPTVVSDIKKIRSQLQKNEKYIWNLKTCNSKLMGQRRNHKRNIKYLE